MAMCYLSPNSGTSRCFEGRRLCTLAHLPPTHISHRRLPDRRRRVDSSCCSIVSGGISFVYTPMWTLESGVRTTDDPCWAHSNSAKSKITWESALSEVND